jgi:hypothetical protein
MRAVKLAVAKSGGCSSGPMKATFRFRSRTVSVNGLSRFALPANPIRRLLLFRSPAADRFPER